MADFERCFQVKEEKGLKIICLKPVIYNEDIETLLGSPTYITKTQQSEQWTFVFEKEYPDKKNEEGDFDILLEMVFKDDLLKEIHLPERFLVIMPKWFLIMICKSMGNAQIDRKERTAKGTYKTQEKETSQIRTPKQSEVLKFLGKPFSQKEDDVNFKPFYKYQLKEKTKRPDDAAACVWVEFTFQKKDEILLKVDADLCGMGLSLDFSSNNKDEKKPDKK
jgi:hypothetical protein